MVGEVHCAPFDYWSKFIHFSILIDIGDGGDNVIPLPNITLSILKLVMEYCTWHYIHWTEPPEVREGELERKTTDDIIPWDKAFTQKLDMATLYDVILVHSYVMFNRGTKLIGATGC